jgi:hypothetical protein|eukprot:3950462-Prymnesium_polylepis.1
MQDATAVAAAPDLPSPMTATVNPSTFVYDFGEHPDPMVSDFLQWSAPSRLSDQWAHSQVGRDALGELGRHFFERSL